MVLSTSGILLGLSQGGISLGSHTTSNKQTWRQLLQDHTAILSCVSPSDGALYIPELVQEKKDLQMVRLYPISCLFSHKSPTLKDINPLRGLAGSFRTTATTDSYFVSSREHKYTSHTAQGILLSSRARVHTK